MRSYLVSLAELDDRISHRLRLGSVSDLTTCSSARKGAWWKLAAFLAHSGDSWFWVAGLGIIWLFTGQEWHFRATALIVGIVLLAAMVMAIKFTVRRQRPPGLWGSIYRSVDPHSFPSGHAARAALLAVMAWQLGPAWFAFLLLIWAPLVSLARVAMGVHYLSDILAGFFLGILVALILLQILPFAIQTWPFLFYDWRTLLGLLLGK